MPARPRVALATSAAFLHLDEDMPLVLAALAAADVDAEPVGWDDPGAVWAAWDLVLVRSTWDYTARRAAFLDWAAGVPRLANPAEVLAWNTDKTYLRDLAAAGVPVVETQWVTDGAWERPAGEYVVKPSVGAGSRGAARYRAGEDASEHVARLREAGQTVMVQPYQHGVDEAGETAVLWFGGAFSHAARKGALLQPGGGEPPDSRSVVTPAAATQEQVALAQAALAVVPGAEPLLYARVDVVPGPTGTPVVLELEVCEPSLFLRHAAGSAERFAAAVCAVLAGG